MPRAFDKGILMRLPPGCSMFIILGSAIAAVIAFLAGAGELGASFVALAIINGIFYLVGSADAHLERRKAMSDFAEAAMADRVLKVLKTKPAGMSLGEVSTELRMQARRQELSDPIDRLVILGLVNEVVAEKDGQQVKLYRVCDRLAD